MYRPGVAGGRLRTNLALVIAQFTVPATATRQSAGHTLCNAWQYFRFARDAGQIKLGWLQDARIRIYDYISPRTAATAQRPYM